MTQTINTSDLKTILDVLPNEPAEVTIVSRTEPAMRKTNNPYLGKVFKVSTASGTINWHYAEEVNHQRRRESTFSVVNGIPQAEDVEHFKAKPRKWGTRLPNSPFVHHIDKQGNEHYYLEMKVNESQGHEYRDDNNEPIDPEKLEKIKSFFSKKSSSSRQGVKGEIILRDYRFDRIIAITLHSSNMTFLVDNTPVVGMTA